MPTKEKTPLSKKSCSSRMLLIPSSNSGGNLSRGVNSLMKIISVFFMIAYQLHRLRCARIRDICGIGKIANNFHTAIIQGLELLTNF